MHGLALTGVVVKPPKRSTAVAAARTVGFATNHFYVTPCEDGRRHLDASQEHRLVCMSRGRHVVVDLDRAIVFKIRHGMTLQGVLQ
jgi:hypothetical protein